MKHILVIISIASLFVSCEKSTPSPVNGGGTGSGGGSGSGSGSGGGTGGGTGGSGGGSGGSGSGARVAVVKGFSGGTVVIGADNKVVSADFTAIGGTQIIVDNSGANLNMTFKNNSDATFSSGMQSGQPYFIYSNRVLISPASVTSADTVTAFTVRLSVPLNAAPIANCSCHDIYLVSSGLAANDGRIQVLNAVNTNGFTNSYFTNVYSQSGVKLIAYQ